MVSLILRLKWPRNAKKEPPNKRDAAQYAAMGGRAQELSKGA
jgi:hypothetical protein